MKWIDVADAARRLSTLLEVVAAHGAPFEIVHGEDVLARIVPVTKRETAKITELDELFRCIPRLGAEEALKFDADIRSIRGDAANMRER